MILLNSPIPTIAGRRYCITTVSAISIIATIDGTEFDLLGGKPVTGQSEFIAPGAIIEIRSTAQPESGENGTPPTMFGDSSESVPGSIVEIVRG